VLINKKKKNCHLKNKKKKKKKISLEENKFLSFVNEIIDKVTKNLESFQYNVLIANFHEIYNFLSKIKINEINNLILLENYLKILIIFNSVVPHFSSECINDLERKHAIYWPIIDVSKIQKKKRTIVIQINGKKRGLITCDVNTDENKILELIESEEQYKKYFEDEAIKKTIYVKDRLINLIL